MIVFFTSCGKTHDEHSDIEETVVTEQASAEENEKVDDKEGIGSEKLAEGSEATEGTDAEVEGKAHIAPAEQQGIRQLQEEIERALRG